MKILPPTLPTPAPRLTTPSPARIVPFGAPPPDAADEDFADGSVEMNGDGSQFRVARNLLPAAAASFDLYVSAAGSDTNDGSEATPLRSLAKAKTVMMERAAWFNQVRIYLMTAGTYTSVDWDGARFIGDGSRPGRLAIIGAEASKTIDLAGTVTAGSTKLLMNTSALGADNAHRGRFVVRRDGAGVVLDERLIIANTATSLTPATQFMAAPAVTDTFQIVTPGAALTGDFNVSSFLGTAVNSAATPPSGLFLVNLKCDSVQPASSFIYCKEVVQVFPKAFYAASPDTQIMLGHVGPSYLVLGLLAWLGAPTDSAWYGAGLTGGRQDPPVGGLIDGFMVLQFTLSPYRHHTGRIIVRGGCWRGNGTASILIDLENAPSDSLLMTTPVDSSMTVKTLLANAVGPAIRLWSPGARTLIANVQFAVGGKCVAVSCGAEAILENASIAGGSTGADAVEVSTGGIVRHKGAPVLTGAGGGVDNRIADATVVTQPNSFFSSVGAVMGPSAQASQIIRIS